MTESEDLPRMSRVQRRVEEFKEKRILMARAGWQGELIGSFDFRTKTGLHCGIRPILDYLTGRVSTELPSEVVVESAAVLACNGWRIEYDEKLRMVRVSPI